MPAALWLSRVLLTGLAAIFGGVGVFCLWASFYSLRSTEAALAAIMIALAVGIRLGMGR